MEFKTRDFIKIRENKRFIYTTALLVKDKDDILDEGKLLFYYTGNNISTIDDFYKDFLYAGINKVEFEKHNLLETKSMGFIIDNGTWEFNNFVFEVLAKAFLEQWTKHELNPSYREEKEI